MVHRKIRLSKGPDTTEKVVTRLDLRQIIVDASWKGTVLKEVEFASRALLNDEDSWDGIPNLEVEILVKEAEVGKVVDRLVKKLESRERRNHCRVVIGKE